VTEASNEPQVSKVLYNRSHKWQCAAPRKYGTQQQGGSHKAGELKKLVYETGSRSFASIEVRGRLLPPNCIILTIFDPPSQCRIRVAEEKICFT
jgi:hypothetical protein